MQLYIYDHCPFCVKTRMIFGFRQQPVRLHFLPYDDEQTPISLAGKKMLPLLIKDDNTAMMESLDIVSYIDNLHHAPVLIGHHSEALADWMKKINEYLNKLIMPVIPQTDFKEFATSSARDYYIRKKQAIMGPLDQLQAQRSLWVTLINQDLQHLVPLITRDIAANDTLSLDDIHLFPVLRALTLINEIIWPDKVARLRDNLSAQSGVPLLFSLAK